MRDKELVVEFTPGDRVITAKHVYQWDYGVQLTIRGNGLKAMDLHFACANSKASYVVTGWLSRGIPQVLTCTIPNVLLMQDSTIKCYMYLEDDDSGVTVREIVIPVIHRARPMESHYTPEEHAQFDVLMSQLRTLLSDTQDAQDLISEGAVIADKLVNLHMEVNQTDGCLYLDM